MWHHAGIHGDFFFATVQTVPEFCHFAWQQNRQCKNFAFDFGLCFKSSSGSQRISESYQCSCLKLAILALFNMQLSAGCCNLSGDVFLFITILCIIFPWTCWDGVCNLHPSSFWHYAVHQQICKIFRTKIWALLVQTVAIMSTRSDSHTWLDSCHLWLERVFVILSSSIHSVHLIWGIMGQFRSRNCFLT